MGFNAVPEGPLGASSYTEDGITVDSLDLYTLAGSGQPLGIERATLAFIGFPSFSGPNVLDFGTVTPGNLVSMDPFGSLRILPPVDTNYARVRMYVLLEPYTPNALVLAARQGNVVVGTDIQLLPVGSGVHEVTLIVSGIVFDNLILSSSGPNDGGRTPAVIDEIRTLTAPAGFQFCYGDGSGSACPCGNETTITSGCANSTGQGALAYAYGSTSLALDQLEFGATFLPSGVPALLFSSGSTPGGSSFGVPFGDGLRCLSGPVRRLGVEFVQPDGRVNWVDQQLLSRSGIAPGNTAYFQVWYRDPLGPCGSGFNFSNGYFLNVTN